jgi:CRISPR/Cas system-associated protein Cas10 (large subunit of type III CRISPR-Cas system)
LRDVGTDAQRLEIVAALIRDPAIKKADLAYVIFGDERKTWHLRRLLAPSERPCSSCGRPVPTTNGNLDGRLLCDSCDATEHAEREKESRQREARNEAQCQRRRKRFEELRAKCGVNDEEFAELIGLAAWEIDNPNNRGCQ